MEQLNNGGEVIASCPGCGARVRLDQQRHGGKRIKMRCGRCGEIHHTDVPTLTEKTAKKGIQVVVAHSDPALCAAVGEVLVPYPDITWQPAHSGEAALTLMEQLMPDVAVVDVALPGLFAFELVEKVRQRKGLKDVKLVLLSSVYNKMAYKRTPNSIYGADDYIEKHHLPTDLVAKLRRLTGHDLPATMVASTAGGGSTVSTALHPVGSSRSEVETLNSKLQLAESTEITAANDAQETLEKARRLARIIVSDIALYNQDRVEEGVRNGTFFSLLADEIAEGRKLFNERVTADLPGRDQILQETFENFIERRRHELQH